MLIKDLEAKSALDRATIRFYEKEGLITPERKENGYRTYSDADLDTLLKVKLLRQLGMSIDNIKDIQQGQGSLTAAAEQQIGILEAKIKGTERSLEICREIRNSGSGYLDHLVNCLEFHSTIHIDPYSGISASSIRDYPGKMGAGTSRRIL